MERRNTNHLYLVPKSQCMFLAILLIIHGVPSNSAILSFKAPNATEEQALLSFKALITDDPQGVLTSWVVGNGTTTSDVCSWRGVGCHSRKHPGRITSLDLAFSNLTGMLSPHLANLTFLHRLNLSYNHISGNIPWELGFLRRLSYLNVRRNSLHGEIPLSLSHLSKLQTLNLEYNNLVGEIPANFSYCLELEVLYVGVNQLSGPIPASFGSLSKLKRLGIRSNHLMGGIPPSLGNLSSLNYFYAGMNNLKGQIPNSLGGMKNLVFLGLAFARLSGTVPRAMFNISSIIAFELAGNNNLSGIIPSDIGVTLPNLRYLLLYDCQFTGPIPYSLPNASHLRIINLGENEFKGTVPPNIGTLRYLEVLSLPSNQLEAKWEKDWELLMSLANCSQLSTLSLSMNNFEGAFPPSLVNLSTTIRTLHMSDNKIFGTIDPDIRKLVKLSTLALSDNLLTGTIPSTIGELHGLEGLYLSNNDINGQIPSSVGNLTHLSILYLLGNKLQGSIPTSLGRLGSLADLALSYNQLNGTIPKQLGNLQSLTQNLDLSNNFLTGQIPLEIGNLANLVLIDLSHNKLSGDIPTTLGKCVELIKLTLQDNLLHGVIPRSLGDLKGIQELDISRNNLTGLVPQFFDTFPYMKYLNLSYNNLEGPIPVGGVFSNASGFFIAGNKVCGGITDLRLPQCPLHTSIVKKQRQRRVLLTCIIVGVVLMLLVLLTCSLLLCLNRQQRKKSPTTSIFKDQHWQVSFAELQQATNQFSPSNLVGTGSFGSVYRGNLGSNSQDVAIKIFDLLQHGAECSFSAECNALRSIRHRNLVKVITACSSIDHHGNDFKALVYEFMPNGDLDNWLHQSSIVVNDASKRLTMVQRLNIALDVAKALDYLHHHGQVPIVHCDLKPSNVLLDNDMVARVGDFGLSRFLHKTVSKSTKDASTSVGVRGTIGYIAPEYGMRGEVSVEGDVYSYGVVLLEMFTGKKPTNSLFQGSHTLQSYVTMYYPHRVTEIVDPNLLPLAQSKTTNGDSSYNFEAAKLQECMVSIFRVGLQCAEESSRMRMHMKDVIEELLMVRDVCIRYSKEATNLC